MKNLKSIIALLVLTVFSVNAWGETTEELTSTELTNNITNTTCAYSTSKTYTDGTIDYVFYVYTDQPSRPWVQMKKDKGVYIKITAPEAIKEVVVTITSGQNSSGGIADIAKHTAYSGRLALLESDAAGSAEMTGVAFTDAVSNNIMTLTPSGTNKELYLKVSTGARIWGITVIYGSSCTDPTTPLSITSAATVKTGKTITLASNGGNDGTVKWSVENGTGTASIANGILTAGNVGTVTVKAHQDQNGQTCETDAEQTVTITPITFTDYITECSSDPSISVSTAELSGFTYIYTQGPSAAKTVTVNGFYLQNNVTVTASDNYEICLSQDGTYTSTINLTPVDQMVNTPVYVRLKAGKDANSYNGTLTVASTGLDSKTVSLSGSVTPAPLATPEVTATPAVHQITLSWEAVSNADSYQLVWNGGAPETVTSLSVVKDNLKGGQSYSYSITAIGSGNYTNSSAAEGNAIAVKETFTVKFYVNGTPNEVSIEEGEKIKDHFPQTPAAFDQDFQTFVGWTISAINGIAENEPTLITDETVTGEANYYAVFAGETLGNTYTWHKEKTLPDGNYLIAGYSNNDYLMKNTLVSLYYIDADNQGDSYSSYEEPDETNIWKLTTTTNGTTIYNEKIEKYVELYQDGKYYDLRFSADPCYFIVTAGNNVFTIKSKTYDSYYLVFDPDHSNFAAKNSSSNLYLFKQDVTPNGYITNKTDRVTLHYDANAGEEVIAGVPQDARINKNEAFTLPTDELTRTGYTHLGWNESNTATEPQTTITPTEDVTVYAVWQINSYTLTWELNGGTVTEEGTPDGSVEFGTTLTAPVLEKTGYTYTWSPVVPATMPASDATYSAIWTANKYEITYLDENGAEFSSSTAGLPTTHTYGTATTLVNPTKEHFTFNGWYINSDCSGDALTSLAADGYTDNITLYAKWTEDSKVTVTFLDAIHNNNSDYQEYVDDLIKFPTIIDATPGEDCEGEHYHFVGWTKDASKPNELVTPASETAPETDITYYAVWAKASSEGAVAVNTVLWGENFAHFGTNTPSAAGTGTGTTIYDGASITYDQSSTNTKGYDANLAGGTAPELLLSKSNQTWTISGIKSGAAKEISLTFLANKTAFSLTCSSDAYTVGGEEKSWTLTLVDGKTAPETFNLTLKNTSSGDNARIDNVVLKITEAGITYSDYVTQCTPTYTVNFFTNSGDAEPYATQKVEENQKATAPDPAPTKDGATFIGWFTADDEALADKTITEATDFIAKWNYTAPTITGQPSGGEYSIGNVVTLLVVAEPIEGVTFTYQWQRLNGSTYEDIAGATNNYYTAPTTEESVNTYHCVVTNGDASTTSNPAQVTVHPASYCAMPTIRIDELGEATAFIREATVTMECGNEGATIYYTLDGSDPKADGANPATYTAPFTIDATKTIEAYAIATDLEPSSVQEKTFTKATLQSIAVKTAKTEYTALEAFNPTDLVITATYNYDLSEDVDYANHSSEFTFAPTLTTELGVDVEAVKIGWRGKETEQQITVNCIAIDAPAPGQPEEKQFTEVTIEWEDVANADHYELSWEGGAAETVTSPYKKEGLTYSKTYHYTLTAVGKTNYCNATAENQEAKTKNRMLIGIDDTKPIICTHGNYFAGQTIKNTDFTVTLLYNNEDTEEGTPNYIGLSEPVESTKETDALTAGQEGALTVYLKSASKTVSTTVTVANPSVTFNVPSGAEAPTAIHRGDNYPSMPNITDCGDNEYDYTFVGWVENTVGAETTTEPENIITAGTTCEITANQVVYALYKRTFNDEENATWTLISSKANIVSGATYLLLTNDQSNAYAGEVNGSGHFTTASVNYSSNPPVVSNACQVVLTSIGTDIYTIKDCNDKYLTASAAKSGSAKLSDSDASGWKFTNATSGMNAQYQETGKNAYLRSYDNTTFRTYSDNSSGKSIYLAKKVPTINTYYITTPNCAKRVPVSLDLDLTNVQQEFYVNDAFNSDNLVVTAHFDNEDVEDVSASAFVMAPDMTAATEKATVTVSYTENETTVYQTYTVLIKERVASVVTLVSVGKESTLSGTHYTGEQVNLPTEPSLTVKGYEFMGWSTNEIETPSSCPTTGFYAAGASFDLTQPAYTFYAVYALGAGSASDNDKFGLSEVTDPADLVDGGMYMITIDNNSSTLAATTVSNSAIQTVTDFKTEQLEGNESYIWKLFASDDNTFKMQMSDNKYLSNTGSTSVSAQNNATDAASWTLTYGTNSESGWRIQNTNTNGRFLGLTGASDTEIKAYSPSDNNNWGKYPHVFTIYRLMGGYTTAPTLVVDGTDITEIPEDFNGNVIVENVVDVTLNEPATWKNLTIKNGGKVTTNAALTINNLLIETKMGSGTGTTKTTKASCGQLIIGDGGSVTASGSAIIENQIDPTGVASYGWYTFSVPFPVSAQNGIYFGETKLTNGVDYAIMEYLGDVRAQGQYGWKKFSGILQPGVMYTLSVADTDYGKLRFKKTAEGDLVSANSWTAGIYGGGEETDANWNAIGNPNLAISQFVNDGGVQTLQLYDHANNAFTTHLKGDLNIVVGSGFFIQAVGEKKNITMKVKETDRGYRAPLEEAEEKPFIAVQLLQGETMNDQVFLNADANASLSYEIGRDVAKIFMQGDAKCAQIYVPAYGTNLCAAQFPFNANNEALFPLTLTAPKEGAYTIAAENVPEGVNLFLEQDGALIWNLNNSAYEIYLNKGETNEYSIRLVANSPLAPTGSETIEAEDNAQKLIINSNFYIIKNGSVYSAQGQLVKQNK